MIRHEDLVRAAGRFLNQTAPVTLDERGQAVNWDTRSPAEIAEGLRAVAWLVAPTDGGESP